MTAHAVNNQMAHAVNNPHMTVLGFPSVSKRPIFHAQFGEYLAGLREAKGWNQSDAARFGVKKSKLLTRQVLLHLEAGKTKDPKPDVLRAVALLYGVPYEQIAAKHVACRFGEGVLNGTVSNSTGVTDSPVQTQPPRTEGTHAVSASLDLAAFIDGLTTSERAIVRAITFRFASMLGDRPATTDRGAAEAKRPPARKRVS